VFTDRIARLPKAQFAFALEDKEHFLVASMAMKGALNRSWGQNGQVLPEFLGPDVVADSPSARGKDAIFFNVIKANASDINNGLHQRHLSSVFNDEDEARQSEWFKATAMTRFRCRQRVALFR